MAEAPQKIFAWAAGGADFLDRDGFNGRLLGLTKAAGLGGGEMMRGLQAVCEEFGADGALGLDVAAFTTLLLGGPGVKWGCLRRMLQSYTRR